MLTLRMNLHLFEDGAQEGGEPAAQKTPEVPEAQAAEQAEAQPQAAESPEDRRARYEAMRKEFRDLDDARMERELGKRLRGAEQTRRALDALNEAVTPLYALHGLAPGDIEGLSKAIAGDNSFWERGAANAGMTVEQYKQMQLTAAENQRLQKVIGRQAAEEAANRQLAAWQQEAEAMKADYPDFDLLTEIQNPLFAGLISSKNEATRLSLKAAYEACHVEEIRQMAARNAARQAEENVTRTIAANGRRPQEGGTGENPAAAPGRIDISKLTRAQMREIERRAERGERITFQEGSL